MTITQSLPSNVVFDATKNPKQEKYLKDVLRATVNPDWYRYFFYGGAVRGGKTSVNDVLLIILAKKYPNSRWHIIRESMSTHEKTTIPSFEKFCPSYSSIVKQYNRSHINYHVEFNNGSKIFFSSENIKQDPELDWMKGLETNGIFLEQMEELQERTFDKALERTGSWYIDPMPPALILGTFNPTQTWVKPKIYDKWQEGSLKKPFYFLEALPTDNPFVTKDQWTAWENMDPIAYKRFIQGDWDAFVNTKPFLYCFEETKHLKSLELNPKEVVYLSFDFNVDPIVCLVCQFGVDWIHILDEFRLENSDLYELCPQIKAKYPSVVFRVTGDASGMARSATTKGNINAYTIIINELGISETQIDLPSANPPISESRTLCNAILSNHKDMVIDPKCVFFIEDCRFTKVNDDGTIDKRNSKRTHLLDAWRYFNNSYKSNFIELGY